MGPQDWQRLTLFKHRPSRIAGGPSAAPRPSPVGQRSRGSAVAPQRRNQVEVGQRPSLLLTPTFPWVADATPHTIPCLTRRPSSLSARRGQVLPAVHREVLPTTLTLLRSGTPYPHLTYLKRLKQGSLPQDPSLTDLHDGTDAMTHRNTVSRPCYPSIQGTNVGLPQEQTPPSPASHWTGMPRQPSHDAQRRVPLHMTCQSR